MSHSLLERWRISSFRLAALFGLLFIVATVAVASLICWQINSYLTQRVDSNIAGMAANFEGLTPEQTEIEVHEASIYDMRRSNLYGLFSKDGQWITGNMKTYPRGIVPDGQIHQFAQPTLPAYASCTRDCQEVHGLARALVKSLANGNTLILGRDFTTMEEVRTIVMNASIGSCTAILLAGLLIGFGLTIYPLRRINEIKSTSRRIMQGELDLRMPISKRSDELDMLSGIVNNMLEEIERLLNEVKSVTDTLAHDLRTPLTRLRLTLNRVEQSTTDEQTKPLLQNAIDETNALLSRFRALLRISEIENRQRKSGFREIQLSSVLEQLLEMFEPLAEDSDVKLTLQCDPTSHIYADPDLLFEALSNLVDNAIKFTPPDGSVSVTLSQVDGVPQIDIQDTGCGVPVEEREAVLLRFHRSHTAQTHQPKEGFGLGLSIVAAVMRLHGFQFRFQDAKLGTHITIYCKT